MCGILYTYCCLSYPSLCSTFRITLQFKVCDINIILNFIIKVYRPAFCSRNAKMSREDVIKTQSIAHLRVHVGEEVLSCT